MPTLRKLPGMIPAADFPRFVPLAELRRVEAERDDLAARLGAREGPAAAALWAARREAQDAELARLEAENRRLQLQVARLEAGLRRIRAMLEGKEVPGR